MDRYESARSSLVEFLPSRVDLLGNGVLRLKYLQVLPSSSINLCSLYVFCSGLCWCSCFRLRRQSKILHGMRWSLVGLVDGECFLVAWFVKFYDRSERELMKWISFFFDFD